jgi:hypothetical protein
MPALVHPCCLCIQLGIWNALKGDRTFLCYSLQGGCLRRLCRCPQNVTDLVNLAQSIALHLSSRAIQILRTVKCTYCMNMAIFWCELANLDSHLSGAVSLHSNCWCRRQLQSVSVNNVCGLMSCNQNIPFVLPILIAWKCAVCRAALVDICGGSAYTHCTNQRATKGGFVHFAIPAYQRNCSSCDTVTL